MLFCGKLLFRRNELPFFMPIELLLYLCYNYNKKCDQNLKEVVMDNSFKNYMLQKQVIDDINRTYKVPLLPFDSFQDEDLFNGGMPKQFARCKGSYLRPMFEDLRSGNNNYSTCVDELIYDKKVSMEDLDNISVSCIVKDRDDSTIYSLGSPRRAELISSKIANIFGVKTEYVMPIKGSANKYLAIDFLQENQRFENFNDYFECTSGRSFYSFEDDSCCLKKFLCPMILQLKNDLKNRTGYKKYTQIKQFIVDFIKQYLLKKYILHDTDVCSVNFGVIISKNDITMSPAFDYEQTFNPGRRYSQGFGLEEDIKYIAESYPAILKEVIKDFALDKTKMKNINRVFVLFDNQENRRYSNYNMVINSTIALNGYADMYLTKRVEKIKENTL
jgi:hypothetical protein